VTVRAPHPERPFDEPWQARAFALAVVTVDELGLPWDTFRAHLKAAVADAPDRPYWESWLTALENLTTQHVDAVGSPAACPTRLSSKAGGDRAKR
jgi:hypothetical protein